MEDATRALGKGSLPPGPVPEGQIRVYSMRFCPYAHRTRLVLRAKGIRHEVININLRNKPEWYYTKHPFGQIPVLENSKCQLIYESVIACEYLDDAYPGRKLYPYDPYERARQKMLLELFYKVPHLTKECLVALRCGRECADLKLALHQEFCNLEEISLTSFLGEPRGGATARAPHHRRPQGGARRASSFHRLSRANLSWVLLGEPERPSKKTRASSIRAFSRSGGGNPTVLFYYLS
ncbi:glutathione S-transferase omega-2 isoform X2 [Phoca vitulina]|uniref:glutathione S-transferase omega-2 isoform X2 n=1 Tax=Phoca vitulina TaxID=9720 RepID=UPI001395CB93|nr:glutathione S-transferase omega-2 isoform X2 [Phoca vitulina]